MRESANTTFRADTRGTQFAVMLEYWFIDHTPSTIMIYRRNYLLAYLNIERTLSAKTSLFYTAGR